ncbi:ShTK domain protein [Aphelenchoides besseyi]|nr:ShTK domain protein [Aphelenchoides besseyi]
MQQFVLLFALLCSSIALTAAAGSEDCKDDDFNCPDWIAADSSGCFRTGYIKTACRRSCAFCRYLPRKFDLSRIPPNLQPLSWLIGIWRSEHGGKCIIFVHESNELFRKSEIPDNSSIVFTYGEQLEFSLSDKHMTSTPALNYTAFAWTVNQMDEELHSENGYIAVRQGTREAAMTTVMSNGFLVVEEGAAGSNRIRFRLVDIGRISFSRDLPVHDLIREWTLIDSRTLESRLDMETLTHGMREHTTITYTKVFPLTPLVFLLSVQTFIGYIAGRVNVVCVFVTLSHKRIHLCFNMSNSRQRAY